MKKTDDDQADNDDVYDKWWQLLLQLWYVLWCGKDVAGVGGDGVDGGGVGAEFPQRGAGVSGPQFEVSPTTPRDEVVGGGGGEGKGRHPVLVCCIDGLK